MSQLCLEQRRLIEILHRYGLSNRAIAAEIDVHPTTVGRELKRNSVAGKYTGIRADRYTRQRHRNKAKRHYITDNMRAFIESHLEQYHSPEQIAGLARIRFGFSEFVSTQTIYKYIYTDKQKGGFLYKLLPRGAQIQEIRHI